jgi:NTE family protein
MKAANSIVADRKRTKASQMPKIVNLALQGDGGHGAFTWGMLDRLLEEEALHFEGIAGTSAGAVDAVVLADGLAAGGREGGAGRHHCLKIPGRDTFCQ